MSLEEEEAGQTSEYILVAKLNNAKNISNLLKAVHFKETATVFISENGLKVTVEESKYLQASAFVQSSVFQEYFFSEESATFKINLTVLLECLHIFGSSSKETGSYTALKMCYAGHGSPLKLLLAEDGGVLTDCCINTQEPEEMADFNFSSTDVINKIIMQSAGLKDAFQELDMTSDVIQILMSPEAPFFRISTFGNSGSAHVDYPKDSEMMETFECQQTQSNRYKTSLMKPSTKALLLSNKVSVRMDARGFLSLQYMILNDNGQVCFVEYLCAPNEDDEEEENFD
ncbi:cell cycle checkpoint protein RAD1-like [Hydractinia symbiolongicarpus]|uniref:cell cycle checkpoint protein RAD1-like n=1 Tax=Hydractinia symbiolongicarpus TaxID=13093 RepID=UPI00254E9D1A|nr:cell cycle checkpoint protein RAD1-like [Hydractinia symbiolongicarpus]XP_057295149.1 cell cycle checkpoint protein RAD1-like [Hydractinia symbiolongicarpus]